MMSHDVLPLTLPSCLLSVLKDCPVTDLVPVVSSFGVPSANVE